jgi:Tfp pilus assembly protein PilO
MKLSPREQKLVGIAVVVLAACALYFLALGPALSQSSYLDQEIERVEKKIKNLQQEYQKSKSVEKDKEMLLRFFGPMVMRSDEAEHAGFKLRAVNAAAQAEQVRIISVQPMAPSIKEEFDRFPTQFSLEGDLIGITNLLIRLRHAAPRLDVERVSIRANNQNPDRMSVQMIVSSYAFSKEKEKKRTPARRTAQSP